MLVTTTQTTTSVQPIECLTSPRPQCSKPIRSIQLDLFRSLAVFMVLASHMWSAPRDLSWLTIQVGDWFRTYGHLGVDLFFVLSGFLVAGLLFQEYKSKGSFDVPRFLIRRGFKIYPAFYVFLTITVLLRIKRGTVFSFQEILCESLFLQNYGPHVWSHTWSLAVEEHFYLLLAGLFWFLQRTDSRHPLKSLPVFFILAAIVVPLLRALTFVFLPYTAKTHLFATHLRIDELFFGVFLSYFYHLAPHRLPASRRAKLGMFAIALLIFWFCFHILSSGFWRYVLEPSLVSIAFATLLLVLVSIRLPSHGFVGRFFHFFGFVGSHSYSIYLWHTAVIVFGSIVLQKLMPKGTGYYLYFFLYILTSFVFGILMAKLVELPALRLREHLFSSGGNSCQTVTSKSPYLCDIQRSNF